MQDWQMVEVSNQYKNEMHGLAREARLSRSAQDNAPAPNRFGLFVASTIIFLSVLVWFVF
jgi:hypothetical protein